MPGAGNSTPGPERPDTTGGERPPALESDRAGKELARPEGTTWEGTTWGEALFLASVALVPGIGGALVILLQKAMEDDRRRVADVANAARGVVDDDVRFLERVGEDERLRDMLREALDAGARSSDEAKRVAMGRVLGQAINDDAQIDDDAALLHALAALDSPHFAFLAKLQYREQSEPLTALAEVREPYRSALVAQGCVRLPIASGGFYRGVVPLEVTDFGRSLLEWLRQAQEE